MKYSVKAKLKEITKVGDTWVRLLVEAPDIAASARPGQFVEVKAWNTASPLLRRPFSIAGTTADGCILLLIKVIGPGTSIIGSLSPGDVLDIIGPLGNFFAPSENDETVFLVAGGVGIAPLRFFLEKESSSYIKPVLLFGARDYTETQVINDSLFDTSDVRISTEDGSAGTKGLVTSVLKAAIAKKNANRILTCGPAPMMKAVAELAAGAGTECEASMETYMGCGIGACMGCVVPVIGQNRKYFHACTDGPVMNTAIIDWQALK